MSFQRLYSQMSNNSRILIILGSVLGVSILGGGVTYFGLNFMAEDSIKDIEAEIDEIRLFEVSFSKVTADLSGKLIGSDIKNGEISEFDLKLHYNSTFLGRCTATDKMIKYDETGRFNVSATFLLTNMFAVPQFLLDFLMKDELSLEIEGSVTIKGEFLLSAYKEKGISSKLTVAGMNGFNPQFDRIDLIQGKRYELQLAMYLDLFNPSTATFSIDGALLTQFLQDIEVHYHYQENDPNGFMNTTSFKIASVTIPSINLVSGMNQIITNVSVYNNNEDILSKMISKMILGEPVNITIGLNDDLMFDDLFSILETENLQNGTVISNNTATQNESFVENVMDFLDSSFFDSFLENVNLTIRSLFPLILGIDVPFYNPLNFDFDITQLHMGLYLNDTDGSAFNYNLSEFLSHLNITNNIPFNSTVALFLGNVSNVWINNTDATFYLFNFSDYCVLLNNKEYTSFNTSLLYLFGNLSNFLLNTTQGASLIQDLEEYLISKNVTLNRSLKQTIELLLENITKFITNESYRAKIIQDFLFTHNFTHHLSLNASLLHFLGNLSDFLLNTTQGASLIQNLENFLTELNITLSNPINETIALLLGNITEFIVDASNELNELQSFFTTLNFSQYNTLNTSLLCFLGNLSNFLFNTTEGTLLIQDFEEHLTSLNVTLDRPLNQTIALFLENITKFIANESYRYNIIQDFLIDPNSTHYLSLNTSLLHFLGNLSDFLLNTTEGASLIQDLENYLISQNVTLNSPINQTVALFLENITKFVIETSNRFNELRSFFTTLNFSQYSSLSSSLAIYVGNITDIKFNDTMNVNWFDTVVDFVTFLNETQTVPINSTMVVIITNITNIEISDIVGTLWDFTPQEYYSILNITQNFPLNSSLTLTSNSTTTFGINIVPNISIELLIRLIDEILQEELQLSGKGIIGLAIEEFELNIQFPMDIVN